MDSPAEFAYREDIRFRVIEDFIREATKRMKRTYTGQLSKEDKRLIEAAERALTSIGMQMEGAYTDQLSLFKDMPTKKAVQEEWKGRKRRVPARSKSGTAPTDPLRS